MKGVADDKWVRLSVASINARDDLRKLAAEIDRGLKVRGNDDVKLLQRVRAVAIRHADGLRIALKHPH